MIKITSDGTAVGTQVTNADGTPIRGITRIDFDPIVGGGIVNAVLHFEMVKLDIAVNTDEAPA